MAGVRNTNFHKIRVRLVVDLIIATRRAHPHVSYQFFVLSKKQRSSSVFGPFECHKAVGKGGFCVIVNYNIVQLSERREI